MTQVTSATTVTETRTEVDLRTVEDPPTTMKEEQPVETEKKSKTYYTNEPIKEEEVIQSAQEDTTQQSNQASSKSASTRRIAVDFNSSVPPQDQAFDKYAVMEGKLKLIPISSVYSALVDLNMNPSRTKLGVYMKNYNIPSIGMSNMQFKDICKYFQFTIADIDKLIDIFLILDPDTSLQINKEDLAKFLSMAPKKDAIVGPSFENLYGDMEPEGKGFVTIRQFLLAYFPDPIAVDEALRRRGLLKEPTPLPTPPPEPEPVRDFDAEFAAIVREEEQNRKKLENDYNSELERIRKDMFNKYQQLMVKAKPVEKKESGSCPCCSIC